MRTLVTVAKLRGTSGSDAPTQKKILAFELLEKKIPKINDEFLNILALIILLQQLKVFEKCTHLRSIADIAGMGFGFLSVLSFIGIQFR